MTIQKTQTLYEILWRFDETGTFQGAHAKHIETIKNTDTGEIYAVKETPPVAVAEVDVAGLMQKSFVDLANQVTTMTAERIVSNERLANVTNERDGLINRLNSKRK